MSAIRAVVDLAERYNPRELWRVFATDVKQQPDGCWLVTFPTELHGLAAVTASGPDGIVSVTDVGHTPDATGWSSWTNHIAGEYEMHGSLLGPLSPPPSITAYRFEDAWVWDPNVPSVSQSELARLGLLGISEAPFAETLGKGAWAWKAVKLGWKVTGHVSTAIWALEVTHAGWKKLQKEMVDHRGRMERNEHLRRTNLLLAEVRRDRLENGSESSRRRARQYYTTLDALIAANS